MWTPEKPLKEIDDEEVKNIFIEEAKYLLKDLQTNRLETTRVPATREMFEGHKIRMAESENPEWYQRLWKEYIYYYKNIGRRKINKKKLIKRRKPVSYFRRKRAESALTRMINQEDKIMTGKNEFPSNAFSHDFILRSFILGRLTKGYEEKGRYFPPNKKVCNWYGIKINKKYYIEEEKNFKKVMDFFDKKANEQ